MIRRPTHAFLNLALGLHIFPSILVCLNDLLSIQPFENEPDSVILKRKAYALVNTIAQRNRGHSQATRSVLGKLEDVSAYSKLCSLLYNFPLDSPYTFNCFKRSIQYYRLTGSRSEQACETARESRSYIISPNHAPRLYGVAESTGCARAKYAWAVFT